MYFSNIITGSTAWLARTTIELQRFLSNLVRFFSASCLPYWQIIKNGALSISRSDRYNVADSRNSVEAIPT